MPRSHVSVARFYDWTDDLGDCFSVSRLYREIANIPRLDSKGTLRGSQPSLGSGCFSNGAANSSTSTSTMSIASATGAVVHHGTKGQGQHPFYMSPGRMFVRDKKALTRGEREIIEGIYRNRGDVGSSAKDATCCSELHVRSHQEAWLVGKKSAMSGVYNTEGGCGLAGRAIMKGVGLDASNKGSVRPSTDDSQLDTRSRTTASSTSADDIPSSVCPERKDIVDKYPNLSRGKRPLASPESADQPESHDKVKRLIPGRNLVPDYWDSRPSAPPSSPTRCEESPPSTPILQSPPTLRLNPAPLTNCGNVTDKLLAMRPSLPPNAIIIAEKIQSPPTSDKTGRQRLSHPGVASHDTLIGKMFSPGQNFEWTSKCKNLPHGNAQGTFDCDMNLNIPKDDFHTETKRDSKIFFRSEFDATTQNSPDCEKDKKKVQVRVYLPSMGAETHEDDASLKSSLQKERPLSQTAFKSKSFGQHTRPS
ncbi:hypothetical protein ElyMa_000146400 [Elysia marginata]|uniref:Uncharacterized protein n=1 Tax=Elysia marginata TaxID=1093978 RepID=A0AAV4EPM3_9GAST|nr:hypothetical protein ElyMa_000146400 [Elysia marginata]